MKSEFQKEFVGANIQGFCQPDKNLDSGGAFATFNAPDVIGMNVGLFGKSFLAQSRLLSASEHRFANGLPMKWLEHSSYGNRIRNNAPHTQRVGCILYACVLGKTGINTIHWTALDLPGFRI